MAKKKLESKTATEIREEQHDTNVASVATKPSNRMEMMNQAVNLIGMLPKDMALNALDAMLQSIGQESQNIPDDAAAKNAATLTMKPSFAQATQEAVQEIFGDDKELSEEFRKKAETIFEAALNTRVALAREEMSEELREQAEKEVEEALQNLTAQLDQYLDAIAEAWVSENEVAIQSTLQAEITEDLISDLKQVFENHMITIPEEKIDAVAALGEKVDDLQTQLSDAVNANIALAGELEEFYRKEAIDQVTEGFTVSQRAKFDTLVEGIEFNDAFDNKLDVVKTKYFPEKGVVKPSNILQEDVVEQTGDEPKVYDKTMSKYILAATRINQK